MGSSTDRRQAGAVLEDQRQVRILRLQRERGSDLVEWKRVIRGRKWHPVCVCRIEQDQCLCRCQVSCFVLSRQSYLVKARVQCSADAAQPWRCKMGDACSLCPAAWCWIVDGSILGFACLFCRLHPGLGGTSIWTMWLLVQLWRWGGLDAVLFSLHVLSAPICCPPARPHARHPASLSLPR